MSCYEMQGTLPLPASETPTIHAGLHPMGLGRHWMSNARQAYSFRPIHLRVDTRFVELRTDS